MGNQLTGLNYIEIGGEKRPIKFGTNQTAIYCQTRGCTLSQYLKEMNFDRIVKNEIDGSEIRDLIYSALVAGCYSAKLPDAFTKTDVGDWIDDMDQAELSRVFTIMTAQNSPNGQSAKPQTETTIS
jgi:hypothetical protein